LPNWNVKRNCRTKINYQPELPNRNAKLNCQLELPN
jgi:hypothetical protein